MGGLGDHAGEMIYILLAVLLIVAVMVIVMGLSRTAKKSTNAKTAELNRQVSAVDDQFFEEWDMGEASGVQVKQFIQQAADKDCAVLVQTLALLGNQPTWKANDAVPGDKVIKGITSKAAGATGVTAGGAGSKESTFNGAALADAQRGDATGKGKLPVTMIDFNDGNAMGSHQIGADNMVSTTGAAAFAVQTALRTNVYNSCLVNYGTILKNSVRSSGTNGDNYVSILNDDGANGVQGETVISARSYDDSTGDFGQTIAYLDGRFHTKAEFATSQSGINLRYDSTTDLNQSGKTMYISDTASFNSYVLVDSADKYVGVVFIETK